MLSRRMRSHLFKPATRILLSGFMALSLSVTASTFPIWAQNNSNMQDYADYAQQATIAIERGDLTSAIQLFEKALPLASGASQSIIYNNLATVYMRRGNYFHDKMKQDAQSLNDYRRAYYYMELAWPEGMERKPLHLSNLKIARDDLKGGYLNNNIDPNDKAVHLKLAKELRLQGKFQESLVEYSRAAELDNGNAEALKGLGDLFNVMNMPDKSKKYYARLVNIQGGNVKDDTLVQLASAQNKSGQLNEAIANLNKALEINPNNTSALGQLEAIWKTELKFNPASVLGHANLAGIYQKMHRYDEAKAQYNAAEHFAGQDPKTPFDIKKLIRLNMGTMFQETKQYDMAMNAYDTILAADRNNQQATLYKAKLFKEMGKTDEAIKWYHNLLSLDPNNQGAHEDILGIITQQTDSQRVSLALKTYGDRFPDNALLQYKVGEELHRIKDYEGAITFYQRALQLKPDMAAAYANLGAVYQAQGKDEESLQAFKKALTLDPNNETVKSLARDTEQAAGTKYFQKGVELQQAGNNEAALPEFKKALETLSSDPQLHSAYGIALQNTNRIGEAITEYGKAIALDANNANYPYYLGTAYHQNKQLDKAKAAYQKALALDGSLAEARNAIDLINKQGASSKLDEAMTAYTQKKYPQALALVNDSLKEDPANATAYYYKGLIQSEQKLPDAAIQSYRQAIEHKPDFPDAYYALGVLLDTRKDIQGAKAAFQKYLELSTGNEDDFVKYARQRFESL